jgi:hypothetical protein
MYVGQMSVGQMSVGQMSKTNGFRLKGMSPGCCYNKGTGRPLCMHSKLCHVAF